MIMAVVKMIEEKRFACKKTERYDGQEISIVEGPPTLEKRGPAT